MSIFVCLFKPPPLEFQLVRDASTSNDSPWFPFRVGIPRVSILRPCWTLYLRSLLDTNVPKSAISARLCSTWRPNTARQRLLNTPRGGIVTTRMHRRRSWSCNDVSRIMGKPRFPFIDPPRKSLPIFPRIRQQYSRQKFVYRTIKCTLCDPSVPDHVKTLGSPRRAANADTRGCPNVWRVIL